MAAGELALEELLSRLRKEQGAARHGAAQLAHEALSARAASGAALARRLALSEAAREALERAVRGGAHALAAAEARAAAASEALRQRVPPAGAAADLARREAAEWQRRAREAEQAQRDALAALAAAAASHAPAPPADDAAEEELQSQAALVADLAARLDGGAAREAALRDALRSCEALCGAHLHARQAAEAEADALRLAAGADHY
jgi:hypothetical protein